jgi:alkanesulfonate monooxygenase SsuD/methylene tetrahydromethanopterin reductase-like flavin-dependent oxidoreductase (luciferase family)
LTLRRNVPLDPAEQHPGTTSTPRGRQAGTPAEVADQMEDYVVQVGGDGFMLSPIDTAGAMEEFVDLVVPELQRRGRYRRDYAGATQRDHLMQQR